MTGMNTPISTQVQVEIEALHQFFEDWFTGRLPKTEAAYQRFSQALGDDFVIVAPSGHARERATLLQGLWDAHDSHAAMRIWIEKVQLRRVRGDVIWTTYEEWQEIGGQTTGRLSTVIFTKQADDEHPLLWQHVHETWLPGNTTNA